MTNLTTMTLADQAGNPLNFGSLLDPAALILVFYRGDW